MLKHVMSAAVGVVLAVFTFAGTASADTAKYNNPTYNGNRVDFCVNWGVGCGAQAANAWCQYKGFDKATSFKEANDIGASSPTRLLGTGAVCDQGFCDGFAYIACEKPPQNVVFKSPTYNGNRLDWCTNWGTGCGAPAATAYCQVQGHPVAVSYIKAENIGTATPTRLIATGALCDQAMCDGFKSITCSP